MPHWVMTSDFFSVTRTAGELSVVVAVDEVPEEVNEEAKNSAGYSGGWRALKVAGPLDFELVGVLSDLVGPLARDGVSIFAVSTFDTDYLLVRQEKLRQVKQTLVDEGHELL